MKRKTNYNGRLKFTDNDYLRINGNKNNKRDDINSKKEVVYGQIQNRILIVNLVYSFILLIVMEGVARTNIIGAFVFLREDSIQFFVNYILIFLIVSLSLFFKRKIFYRYIVGLIGFILSLVSGILLNLRNMPLFPYDLLSYREALKISSLFLSVRSEIFAVVILIVLIVLSIIIFVIEGRKVNKKTTFINYDKDTKSYNKRSKNNSENKNMAKTLLNGLSSFVKKRKLGRRNIIIFLVLLSFYAISVPQLSKAKILNVMAWNMTGSYEKNGFTYSFLRECALSFRRKPKHYNEKTMKALRRELDEDVKKDKRKIVKGNERPNIVVVQLEAFMDPTRLKGVEFNKDPIPNTRNLMKHFTSGVMKVPVTGGGTARTEYEILSGATFDYLNSGEIPYETFLSQKPSESLATTLNKYGYRSIAIHNFYQNFYNRNKGLENLGFYRFIPLDVMTNVEYTPLYWPKDKILTRYISDELNKNTGKLGKKRIPKFIFTISTQGHSRYPFNKVDINYPIKIVKSNISKGDENQIYYYANQVHEMDEFVGDLVKAINKTKKPTILVLYGDHLPALDLIKKNEAGVNKYESLFVIANNYGGGRLKLPRDFSSNDMSTEILKEARLPYGPMNLVHAYDRNSKDYMSKLKLIQYDILFGKKYFLKKNEIQGINHMKINNEELKLDKVVERNGDYYVVGSGFNRNTKVYLDGKEVDSVYYDENDIKLFDSFYTGKKEIQLKIVDNNGKVFQETKKIKYNFR